MNPAHLWMPLLLQSISSPILAMTWLNEREKSLMCFPVNCFKEWRAVEVVLVKLWTWWFCTANPGLNLLRELWHNLVADVSAACGKGSSSGPFSSEHNSVSPRCCKWEQSSRSAWHTKPWRSTSRLHHEGGWGLPCSQAASSNSKQGKAWGRGLEGSEWGNVTHPTHSSARCTGEKPGTAGPTEMESSGTVGIAPKAKAWPPVQCWAPASLGQPLWHSVWHCCAKR